VPTFGKITLLVMVSDKAVDQVFEVIPLSDLFHVNVGHLWLKSMNVVPTTIHNFIKFPLHEHMPTIRRDTYQLLAMYKNFTIDYFWLQPDRDPKPSRDHSFLQYRLYKAKLISRVVGPPMQKIRDEQPAFEELASKRHYSGIDLYVVIDGNKAQISHQHDRKT